MKKFLLTASLSFLFTFFFAVPTFAAIITISTPNTNTDLNQQLKVRFVFNTQGQSVNAIEGDVDFSHESLQLKELRLGTSIVILWLEKPNVNTNKIHFSGIIPGGYVGSDGTILEAVFETKTSGKANIQVNNFKAFLNDGNGMSLSVSSAPQSIMVSKQVSTLVASSSPLDKGLPETFRPQIGKDPNLFEGQYFIAFVTEDKLSGVDYYEVCEGSEKNCFTAESPYVLTDQTLHQKIIVKAFDMEGNVREVIVPAVNPLPWYKNILVIAILIVLSVTFLFLFFKVL